MRAARLISLVLLLQNRGSLTGPQLAAELGVSERTIARDVAELGEAGIPVYAQQGRAGGYRLLDGFRTRLTGLGRAEVEALFLSGAPDALHAMGLDEAALAARLKVGAALSPSARDAPQRVQRRFHLDAPGWFRRTATPPQLPELSTALWNDLRIRVGYLRGRRLAETAEPAPVQRELEPYGLVLKAGVWYLVARSAGEYRVYRAERFAEVTVTQERFDRDDAFDLSLFWQRSAADFARSMLHLNLTVRLSPSGRAQLATVLDSVAADEVVEIEAADRHGWVTVTIPTETIDVGYQQMLLLGPEAEVLSPPQLRRRLAAAAERTARLYR